ncbi:HNH endonuclease [Taibaiella lutea]|nr:NUMOD3 domain-containing DNA-binding protein [Taibaiella lutea]
MNLDFYNQQVSNGLKWCFKCRKWISKALFNIDNSRWDRLVSKCRFCQRVKVKVVTKGRVSTFKGKLHTEDSKQKMRIINKGPGNPNWKGGISSLILQIRNTERYKKWRRDVYRKDQFTCTHCNVKKAGNNITIDADHIIPLAKIVFEDNIKTIEEALLNERIFEVENGRCLCRKCHKNTPTWGVNINKKIRNGKRK